MIKVSFHKSPDWQFLGLTPMRKLREQIQRDLRDGLQGMQESIMETPVYTGRTLINYRWSTGKAIKDQRSPVQKPALPGTTSGLAIGLEPRRAAQTPTVRKEFREILQAIATNPFQDFYLTNNTPYFDLIEYGNYASKKGAKSRTPPGGMVRKGEAILEASAPGLRKVSDDV